MYNRIQKIPRLPVCGVFKPDQGLGILRGTYIGEYLNATSQSAGGSLPYVVNVNNTTNVDVVNFQLFNANEVVANNSNFIDNAAVFPYYYYEVNGVRVASGTPAQPNYYQTLLAQSQTQPFTVGSTVMVAIVNNQQLQQVISVTHTDSSGLTITEPTTLLKDPHQRQRDMIVMNTPFTIDGNTSVHIPVVYAGANFNMYFYAGSNISPANKMTGSAGVDTYAIPELTRAKHRN